MNVEWARYARGATWALCATAWALLLLDAAPWGWDLEGGIEGVVRGAAIVTALVLVMTRREKESQAAVEIYMAGVEAGYREATEALRARLGSTVDR